MGNISSGAAIRWDRNRLAKMAFCEGCTVAMLTRVCRERQAREKCQEKKCGSCEFHHGAIKVVRPPRLELGMQPSQGRVISVSLQAQALIVSKRPCTARGLKKL